MEWSLVKATPTIAKATGFVVGWELRIHVEHEGASAFDDCKLGVPPITPLNEWTLPMLIQAIEAAYHADATLRMMSCQLPADTAPKLQLLHTMEHLASIVRFRSDYEAIDSFTLTQLGGENHVRLHSVRVQI